MAEDLPDQSTPQISPEEMARLEAQEIANLRKLVEDGKTLTEAQWRRLRAAASIGDSTDTIDGPEWAENQTELARATDLKGSPNTRKTIQRWFNAYGKWSLLSLARAPQGTLQNCFQLLKVDRLN